MASTDLLFDQAPNPTGGPVEIVFGDDGGGGTPDVVELHAAGSITGLRGRIGVRVAARLRAAGSITGLRGRIGVVFNVNVERPLACTTVNGWQDAAPVRASTQVRYEQAQPVPAAVQANWQDARTVGTPHQARWQQAQPLATTARQAMQQAQRLGSAPTLQRFEEAARLRSITLQAMQQALQLAAPPVLQRFEDATRLRHLVQSRFEESQHRQAAVRDVFGRAVPLSRVVAGRYEEARKLPPGISAPVQPPIQTPCYVPVLPAHLVFEDLADSSLPAGLVFVCDGHGPGPDPEPPQFVIPLLRIYMTVHTMSAVLLPSLEPVQLKGVSISSDDDGYAWTLAASGPEHLFDQLAPVDGLPARVRVTLDGIDWVFAIEPPDRSRKFADRSAAVRGRSVTSLLTAPFAPSSTWGNPGGAFTAQQLALQALNMTGVSLDWAITDWLVPAGAWSFQGAPLAVVQRIAEAAGAVVRSHRTDAQLRVAPRYPSLPWEWATATVNVRMPGQIITTDSLTRQDNPDWEAVNVVGELGGVEGHIVRRDTAGVVLAPGVIDPLITHADAASQRGRTVLGPAGRGYTHTMTVPLLTGGTNPGLILPGYLLQVDEPGLTWRGLVRGITVTESNPTVRQQLVVERRP
ncbi:hypothetical protein A1D30_24015 [Acidovorax sp. GW101-3H11]|uniref:hypothetical protein n=1 Tax=Acidovorax sp. GW101-3H11 TaxID=1813946 RepID=UPI0007B5356C|nr:hypothetical protein [Acidovorax sp. GW101-3H11]KZT13322.1 hypothetical protein A1D30_24015 [Acidovorax sp. GW101-3H11]